MSVPPKSRFQRPLGRKRQRIAIIFLVIGLASFFEPLITVSPPVINRTRWSPMATVLALYRGHLTHSVDDIFIIPAEVAAVYLSFLGALAMVCARWSSKAVLTMAIIAAWGAWDVWEGNFQFMQLFFGSPRTLEEITRHTSADVRQLALMLSVVCGVLVFVCLSKNMDE